MRSSKGVSLIALIITIIVIIILAAIVLSSGGDTTNKAQLAVFVNNFSQYQDRIAIQSLTLKQTMGVNQENVNDAQLNYMVANGLKSSKHPEVDGMSMPVGYRLPKTIKKIYGIKTASNDEKLGFNPFSSTAYATAPSYDRERVVAYIVEDGQIEGYNAVPNNLDGSAGYEFYGDTNGEEYHFITSTGHVFTVPGFAVTQDDGTISFYISNEKGAYYTTIGQSDLDVGDRNINGDIVDEWQPITKMNFLINNGFYNDEDNSNLGGLYGVSSNGEPRGKYLYEWEYEDYYYDVYENSSLYYDSQTGSIDYDKLESDARDYAESLMNRSTIINDNHYGQMYEMIK